MGLRIKIYALLYKQLRQFIIYQILHISKSWNKIVKLPLIMRIKY
jgi:hypothetical protein